MAKRAEGIFLVLGDDWRVQYDGERNFEIEERVTIDKSHPKAKQDGPDHRWTGRGFYGTVEGVLRALSSKMTGRFAVENGGTTPDELLGFIDEVNTQLVTAATALTAALKETP